MYPRLATALWTLLALLINALIAEAVADDELFEIVDVETQGRVVTAYFADFNGDQRQDLMVATLAGIPPEETRLLHLYTQLEDGSFPDVASLTVPIPSWSAVYDVADLDATPGDEIAILRPDRVTVLSYANDVMREWDLPVDGPSTVAAGADERGFDAFQMVYDDFGAEPLLLVPQIGAVSIMSAGGDLLGRIDVGRRANYFVARKSGLLAVENDMQLFFDVPKLNVGDVDGDGLTDVIAATRHEIRVFLSAANGAFAAQPDYSIPLQLVSAADHTRGSGSVVVTTKDIDHDGRLDLMITHSEGSFSNTTTNTYTYMNRNGRWDTTEPDDHFVNEGTLSSDLLLDVDNDEKIELVRIQLKFNVLEIVELLLTRKVDTRVEVHRLQADGHYERKPFWTRKISTAINFDTFRPKGFMPSANLDLNADGKMDFITSADGKGIEVYLGGGKRLFRKRDARQNFSSSGVIRFSDYNGDSFPDFVLYDPQVFDQPLRIGRNLGALPRATDAPVTE